MRDSRLRRYNSPVKLWDSVIEGLSPKGHFRREVANSLRSALLGRATFGGRIIKPVLDAAVSYFVTGSPSFSHASIPPTTSLTLE